MIGSKLCFVAEAVIRDTETNAISAFSVFEGITPEALPILVPRMVFFALLERDEGDNPDYEVNFVVYLETTKILENDIKASFGANKRHRHIMTCNGMPIMSPGKMRFELKIGGQLVASYCIEIDAPPGRVAGEKNEKACNGETPQKK